MSPADITFIFTVGGDQCHYDNMERCIRSINRHYLGSKFLILEFGDKLSTSLDREVVNMNGLIDFGSGKKVGYIIWKHKYVGALMVKTKYGVYVDTDTVLVNPNVQHLLESLSGGIAATRHFWVPNIAMYQARACNQSTYSEFLQTKSKLGLEDDSDFFAGGVFLFENNQETKQVFKEVIDHYDEYYRERGYVKSITDEIFFAAALNRRKDLIRIYSGALNHCSMGDEHMPLIVCEDTLYGRNSFESEWQLVTFLHCDTSRRDPSASYDGDTRRLVRSYFELDSAGSSS